MTTYRCPECGHESSIYKPWWHWKAGNQTSEGFEWHCTEGWDIICRKCDSEFCMEHEDNEACNYVPREEIVISDD